MSSSPATASAMTARRIATLIVSAAVSLAIMAALFQAEALPFEAVLQAWGRAAPGPVLAALAVAAICQIGVAPDKLRRVVLASGGALSWRTAVAMRLGAGPLRLATPLRAGGLADALFLNKYGGLSVTGAAGCLAFDRGLNLLGLLSWLLAGLLLIGDGLASALVAAAALAAVLAVFLLTPLHALAERIAGLIHPRLHGLTRSLLTPFARMAPGPRLGLLAYGVAYQSNPFVVCWLLFQGVGYPLSAGQAMAYTNLSMLVGQLPGPLAGIGPREASLIVLVGPQAPEDAVLAAGLLLSFFISLMPLAVGLPWLPWYLHRVASDRASGEDAPVK